VRQLRSRITGVTADLVTAVPATSWRYFGGLPAGHPER